MTSCHKYITYFWQPNMQLYTTDAIDNHSIKQFFAEITFNFLTAFFSFLNIITMKNSH